MSNVGHTETLYEIKKRNNMKIFERLQLLRRKINPDDPRVRERMDDILELAVMGGRLDIVSSPTRLTPKGDVQYLPHQSNDWVTVGRRIHYWEL